MADDKSVVRRYIEEAWNKGRVDVVDEVCAERYVEHDPAFPGGRLGRDGLKQAIATYRTAFPDPTFVIRQMVAEGDTVATHWDVAGFRLRVGTTTGAELEAAARTAT
jgi:predicted SnoaL-like aldol condensation-catalyzing enzyme